MIERCRRLSELQPHMRNTVDGFRVGVAFERDDEYRPAIAERGFHNPPRQNSATRDNSETVHAPSELAVIPWLTDLPRRVLPNEVDDLHDRRAAGELVGHDLKPLQERALRREQQAIGLSH